MHNSKTSVTERVNEALDTMRPYLKAAGGDIEFVEITDQMVLKVEFIGTCTSCAMLPMTLRAGIEEAVKEFAPEIVSVEAVNEELVN